MNEDRMRDSIFDERYSVLPASAAPIASGLMVYTDPSFEAEFIVSCPSGNSGYKYSEKTARHIADAMNLARAAGLMAGANMADRLAARLFINLGEVLRAGGEEKIIEIVAECYARAKKAYPAEAK